MLETEVLLQANQEQVAEILQADIRSIVRCHIESTFLGGSDWQFSDSDSLIGRNIIDSTGFLELVTFLEKSFQIRIHDDEMTPENLDTVTAIVRFVRNHVSS